MAEKQPVSQGEDITITYQNILDSDWGSLVAKRQKIFPTVRVETIITTWITQAKKDLLLRTGRTWDYFTADAEYKIDAYHIIEMLVGVRILRRAQAARVDVTETDYRGQIRELNEEIDVKILNHESENVPVAVGNVEPDLVDPDACYDYDNECDC